MRRLQGVLLLLTILVACRRQVQILPSDEVLKRAAEASRGLSSALYDVEATVLSTTGGSEHELTVKASGRLQEGGRQQTFTLDVEGNWPLGGRSYDVEGRMEVIVAGEDETYIKINSLSLLPPHELLSSDMIIPLLGQWWSLPSGEESGAVSISPSPDILRAQAEVVEVTKDDGITVLRGSDVYRYEVTVNREKLIRYLASVAEERGEPFDETEAGKFFDAFDVKGELWIDAHTFVIHRLLWEIDGKNAGWRATVQMDFSQFGAAPVITPPADAQPFSPDVLLQNLLPAMPLFDQDHSSFEDLPAEERELLDSMLKDTL